MKILIKFLEETSSRKILTQTINNSYYLKGEGQRFHSNHYQKEQIKKITEDLMAEVVKNTGVTKEKGYLYYLDKQGDVSRSKMARAGKGGGNAEKVASAGVTREAGWLYFIDKNGDVSRSPMARGRK